MGKKRIKFSDQVRQAVDECGLSRYAICKTLEMDQATMSRFMNGISGLSMSKLDSLAELLDLDVVPRNKQQKEGR